MTVIAFTATRFTPADLDVFAEVAQPKLSRGHWSGVIRRSGPGFDRLEVLLPGVDRPVFRFERGRDGRYHLSFNDRAGWYAIGCGGTAAECLAIWRPRPAGRPLRGLI